MNPLSAGPINDRRFTEIRHLDMTYAFTAPLTKQAWEERAKCLREQILTGAGLLPMPRKTPLNARIFERIEHDDYSVEKVYFESCPGFYVTGNLYRPVGRKGPFPAVLNPHGHWATGRLANEENGSIPARCISFARQGYIAFSYDMVGYNDSSQLRHREDLLGEREHLWGISVGGLQLWNSIRAVDYLLSLPDVDEKRIACTGESGGGTQTFLLTAVDDRIRFAAPVNMISSTMQGGCVCENPPLIRLDTNNMEIGALAAPRPLMLVSATGDWTVKTPKVEFPAIRSVYELFGASDRVAYVQIDAPHNYNKDSREAVYAWFGRWILGDTNPEHFKEQPFQAEKNEDLLVFARESRPSNALDASGFIESRISASEKQLASMKPGDRASLDAFRAMYGPALRHALVVEMPRQDDLVVTRLDASDPSDTSDLSDLSDCSAERLLIGRKGRGDSIPALLFTLKQSEPKSPATLVVHSEGKSALVENGNPGPLVRGLLQNGESVLLIDCFNVGEHTGPPESADRLTRYKFFDTYNRTDTANRVQDILTALAYLQGRPKVNLAGVGDAGPWCLLARAFAPGVDRTAIDASGLDTADDNAFIGKLYVPCLRRAGDFRTAAALIAPGKLFIHNTRGRFQTDWIESVYRAADAPSALSVRGTTASDSAIVESLGR
ncbi:MAG: acetylxylan esterase [Armatimonadetes bacterium]|nr:acetylxylan esterase [Armatimonadota bacterium]